MSPLVLALAALGVPLLVVMTWALGFGRPTPITTEIVLAELARRGLVAGGPPVVDAEGKGGAVPVAPGRVLIGRAMGDKPMWRLLSLAEVIFRRSEDGRIEVSIPGDLGFSPARWMIAEVPSWMN
jgi:hypothetical protein